jgi:predicted aspartyl protease
LLIITTLDPFSPETAVPRPLPFRYASADIPLILVPARINGQGPYHFLIDTGNGEREPILFRPLAAALGLTTDREAETPGVLGPVRTARARLDRLEVGQTSLTDEPVLVIDQLQLPPVEVTPAGILGHGFFRDRRLVIDYPGRTLEFAASRETRASGTPFSLGAPKPYVIVDVAVDDGPVRSFLLDTGASRTTISPALAAELGLAIEPIEAVAIGGSITAGTAVVSRLEAAGRTERDAPVAVIDLFGPVSLAAGRPIDGVLGYPFLKNCRVEIDYPALRLLLAGPEPGRA